MTLSTFIRCAAWLLAAVVVTVTLSPIELRPVTTVSPSIERLAAFAAVGFAFAAGYPKQRIPMILLVIAGALLLEVSQRFVPGRHGHLHDAMIKILGALAGVAGAVILDRVRSAIRKKQTGT